jgi:hypothetical protein
MFSDHLTPAQAGNHQAGASPGTPSVEPPRPSGWPPYMYIRREWINKNTKIQSLFCLSTTLATRYHHCSTSIPSENRCIKKKGLSSKMPIQGLTDLIVALLHSDASPRHRCRGCGGGRRHR